MKGLNEGPIVSCKPPWVCAELTLALATKSSYDRRPPQEPLVHYEYMASADMTPVLA